jgi:sulfoxide reductase heme-binding subunit YedZ
VTAARRRALKVVVFVLCLLPVAWLVWGAFNGRLGANPIEKITRETGTWALRFLCLTLAVTPVRRLTGWNGVIRFRRMLGLFAFFYACLHLTNFVAIDHFFAFSEILKEIVKRPYITLGMTAFVLLVPLAVTSTAGWVRRLGGRGWQRLHRLVYVAASLAVVHYWALVKADTTRPWRYAAIVAGLLGVRALLAARPPRRHAASPPEAGARPDS